MGILYLDEAGNTGLRDTNQPLLIYGVHILNLRHGRS